MSAQEETLLEGKDPVSPQFTRAPGERSAHPNPDFHWIPTGDCHDS